MTEQIRKALGLLIRVIRGYLGRRLVAGLRSALSKLLLPISDGKVGQDYQPLRKEQGNQPVHEKVEKLDDSFQETGRKIQVNDDQVQRIRNFFPVLELEASR